MTCLAAVFLPLAYGGANSASRHRQAGYLMDLPLLLGAIVADIAMFVLSRHLCANSEISLIGFVDTS